MSQSLSESREWYGLRPESHGGMQQYLADTWTGVRWNGKLRSEYNDTWRCLTPVFHIGRSVLYLGSQKAANNIDRLRACDISMRLSALGWWGCSKATGFRDLQPFRIDDILQYLGTGAASGQYEADFLKEKLHELMNVVWQLDSALVNDRSVLVFCKQGCRRGAALVGCYLLAKTRLAPNIVYRHLKTLRQPVPYLARVLRLGRPVPN